jgi:hypothetical protein
MTGHERTFFRWVKKHRKWTALAAILLSIALGVALYLTSPQYTETIVRFGIVNDTHNANTNRGHLQRQDCIPFLEEFLNELKGWADFVVLNGDMADSWGEAGEYPIDREIIANRLSEVMDTVHASQILYYPVLGNHEIAGINCTKSYIMPFYDMEKPYYSFNVKGFHFIVLDSMDYESSNGMKGNFQRDNFRIYDEQKLWLIQDLKNTREPTIIFVHVPLSGMFEPTDPHGSTYNRITNGAEIRSILEDCEHVIAVFEAHFHNPSAQPIGLDSYIWNEGRIPYYGVNSLVVAEDLKTRAKVTMNAETHTGRVEILGAKPHVWEFNW